MITSAVHLQNFYHRLANWPLIIDDYWLIGTSEIYSYNEGQIFTD